MKGDLKTPCYLMVDHYCLRCRVDCFLAAQDLVVQDQEDPTTSKIGCGRDVEAAEVNLQFTV